MAVMFAVQQLMEKHRGGGDRKDCIVMVCIDIEKACDGVPRLEVWRCVRENGMHM